MEGHQVEISDLASYIVSNVHPTGRELGNGAYGSVEEVEIPGFVCAAKKIHTEFLNIGSHEDISHMITKFTSECKLMSMLHHPHIVQFLGICYLPGARLPSLVMEHLDTSLHDLLETSPNLPLAVKKSVLLDTARGLLYLHDHSPPINSSRSHCEECAPQFRLGSQNCRLGCGSHCEPPTRPASYDDPRTWKYRLHAPRGNGGAHTI